MTYHSWMSVTRTLMTNQTSKHIFIALVSALFWICPLPKRWFCLRSYWKVWTERNIHKFCPWQENLVANGANWESPREKDYQNWDEWPWRNGGGELFVPPDTLMLIVRRKWRKHWSNLFVKIIAPWHSYTFALYIGFPILTSDKLDLFIILGDTQYVVQQRAMESSRIQRATDSNQADFVAWANAMATVWVEHWSLVLY